MSQSVLISTLGMRAKPRFRALPWPRMPMLASTTLSLAPMHAARHRRRRAHRGRREEVVSGDEGRRGDPAHPGRKRAPGHCVLVFWITGHGHLLQSVYPNSRSDQSAPPLAGPPSQPTSRCRMSRSRVLSSEIRAGGQRLAAGPADGQLRSIGRCAGGRQRRGTALMSCCPAARTHGVKAWLELAPSWTRTASLTVSLQDAELGQRPLAGARSGSPDVPRSITEPCCRSNVRLAMTLPAYVATRAASMAAMEVTPDAHGRNALLTCRQPAAPGPDGPATGRFLPPPSVRSHRHRGQARRHLQRGRRDEPAHGPRARAHQPRGRTPGPAVAARQPRATSAGRGPRRWTRSTR